MKFEHFIFLYKIILCYTEQAQTIISSNLGRKFSHNLRDRLKINVLLNNIRVFNDCQLFIFNRRLAGLECSGNTFEAQTGA